MKRVKEQFPGIFDESVDLKDEERLRGFYTTMARFYLLKTADAVKLCESELELLRKSRPEVENQVSVRVDGSHVDTPNTRASGPLLSAQGKVSVLGLNTQLIILLTAAAAVCNHKQETGSPGWRVPAALESADNVS